MIIASLHVKYHDVKTFLALGRKGSACLKWPTNVASASWGRLYVGPETQECKALLSARKNPLDFRPSNEG